MFMDLWISMDIKPTANPAFVLDEFSALKTRARVHFLGMKWGKTRMKQLFLWQSLSEVGELHLVEEEQRDEEKRREEASQREKEKEKEAPETRWWFQICFIFIPNYLGFHDPI